MVQGPHGPRDRFSGRAILNCDPSKTRQAVLRRMVRQALNAPQEDENEFVENVIFGYGRVNESTALLDFKNGNGR